MFTPAHIVVPVGTTVTWLQKGAFPHSATADDGTFDSGVMQTGGKFSFTFKKTGKFTYHCDPHPFMIGEVDVVPAGMPLPPGP